MDISRRRIGIIARREAILGEMIVGMECCFLVKQVN